MKKLALSFVLILSIVCLLTSCNTIHLDYDNSERYSVGNTTLNTSISNLEIEWIDGSVNIEYHDEDTIVINEEYEGELSEEKQLHYYLDGTTLHIKYVASGRVRINTTKDLTVTLPRNKISLEVETVSGDICVWGKEIYEEVSLESVSGRIDFNFDKAENIDVESVSGMVCLYVFGSADGCDVNSVSGNVLVCMMPNPQFTLEMETVSGEFKCVFPTTNTNGKLICGESPTSEFSINTVSGNIHFSNMPE